MVQSVLHQKYKVGVVSGGKVVFPRSSNRSCSAKTVTLLTHDQSGVIVPFNNQLKIYSLETRQCVKTLKYANNKQLTEQFLGPTAGQVCDLALGDVTQEQQKQQEGLESIDDREKHISVFSSSGSVTVVNCKGRLVEEAKVVELGGSFAHNESLVKVFQNDAKTVLRALTSAQESSTAYTYRMYDYNRTEQKLVECRKIEHVLLTAWSANGQHLCALTKDQSSKKVLTLWSVFSSDSSSSSYDENELQLPLPITSSSANASPNSQFVTVMALDNNCTQLAIGFASGVINVLNLQDHSSRLLKWHIDSVLSLCFTPDGSYLLSGGWEKVLSLWQLSTNLQQFLPRLNGVVVDCDIVNDKFYSLGLQLTENQTSSDYQLLILNSTDLNSRVSVSGPLCVYQTAIKDVVLPMSAVSSKASALPSDVGKSSKKQQRKLKRKRQDYSSIFEVQPKTKHLYFPHISAVQAYDFYKNEQVSYQYLASGVNNSMGKVRSELNLKEPTIADVKFTKDGKWMISHEIEFSPDNLLSSNDLQHVLKFWRGSETGDWVLETKVISPHGVKAPVTSILVAPRSVNNSYGCLTADNNGGLKYWFYNEKVSNWQLSKVSSPNNNHFSNSVELAWSIDGSLIFHAFDDKVTVLDFNTFGKFKKDSEGAFNEFTMDSSVQSLMLVNDSNLIVATQTTLNAVNLLLGEVEGAFDLFPYVNGVYRNGHLARLMSCDEKNGRIGFVVNQQNPDDSKQLPAKHTSRVLVFNADLTQRLGSFVHDEYISCIRWNHDTDFIFLDVKNRLGVVSTTTSSEMFEEVDKDAVLDQLGTSRFESELNKLASSKRNAADGIEEHEATEQEEATLGFINGEKSQKLLNMNSFTSMFENLENVQMDTFFDRILKVIS
ncbi:LAME_0F04544g1_1 [Lachancea meyersii CBS 8951]|uniref:LAME_0F04544g1_1 n=1 Tax=Lachancea meyersii CBS 8951 TaxID=1266667 RepID=A0A1G4JS24_9SACH|nr:LAME_0F04544g1_1 [Lachancea meyersii CBS 8951]